MHERTARLRKLMKDNDLTGYQVAEILFRRPNTVYGWIAPDAQRVIPAECLRILELEYPDKNNRGRDGQQAESNAD